MTLPGMYPPRGADHFTMADHYARHGTRPEDTSLGALHALLAVLERLDRWQAILTATAAPAGHEAPRRGVWPDPVERVVTLS